MSFNCTMTFNIPIQYFQWTLWLMTISQETKSGCKGLYISPHGDINPEDSNTPPHHTLSFFFFSFLCVCGGGGHMTLCLTMSHHLAKFGYNRLSGSEDIFHTDRQTGRFQYTSPPPHPPTDPPHTHPTPTPHPPLPNKKRNRYRRHTY